MKKIMLMLVILLSLSFVKGQEVKNLVYDANAEVRKVGNFSGLDVSGAVTVYLSQGNTNAVAISADGGDKAKIITEVKNDVLHIYTESGFWNKWNWSDKKIKAYVTVTDLNKIVLSGASQLNIVDQLKGNALKLKATGASYVKGSFNVAELSINLSGASNATMKGQVGTLNVDVSGASVIKGYDLTVANCDVSASGASNVRVNVEKTFTRLEASGASSIRYKGNPVIQNIQSSGASSIKKED
ncbi:MAG: hypothetical protein GTN67_10525 [Hydrotalea flava]|uniref:head GIN domain-containing protein n=1 Tax=Hydrotalea lipotrueae TaxID=2803817 RepID=UPI0016AC0CE3|nr:head GIN domain-containing protein [Hydrotalea lipotrueae]NIM35783.1 hypothetical protein [Hydrotalea flava]NIM38633.1 hypothetical protein [Hydrotalea flava]NIN03817.1 hypothetical protein [Hydrotalea flava]NIN15511.1 hypothetical protein [Hydrotalea flava]NIO94559.1 hypothetical protein [Hydrotalea flava]